MEAHAKVFHVIWHVKTGLYVSHQPTRFENNNKPELFVRFKKGFKEINYIKVFKVELRIGIQPFQLKAVGPKPTVVCRGIFFT